MGVCVGPRKLGFGEFAEYTYVEVLIRKPKYAEFRMGEGEKDHADVEKFAEWVAQKEVGEIAEEGREAVE